MSVSVRTLFFAAYRDLLGTESADVELPDGATVADLVRSLRSRGEPYASLPEDPPVAVNRSYVSSEHALEDGDEVAFLPPVAGGRAEVHTGITSEPIEPGDVLSRVGAEEDGAVILFLGIVRDHNDGRPVSGIEYRAYREMAEDVLDEIAGEVTERWSTDRVAVVHRVGTLEVGEASVAIAVSTPHRAEAYEASRYVIEAIKERLPVWKREHYVDGERRWVPGRRPRPSEEEAPEPAGGEASSAPPPAPR